jgi:phosphoribosylformimino-5-aminoimidazole carboxamide ribotide isomerase
MIIIPAIDLKQGCCVRLSQGQMDKATVYSQNPAEIAKRWAAMGAKKLHIVDLDGALSGSPQNREAVLSILSSVSIPLQLGGGIRDIDTISEYLSLGLDRIILGTAAIQKPELLEESSHIFPGEIIVGIDAKDGMVSIQGWTEKTQMSVMTFAEKLDLLPIAAMIFTDIKRDGMLVGPNIETTRQLAESTSIPVIASGGVSSLEDIERLLAVEGSGVEAVIIGRALYTGAVDLRECIALAEKRSNNRDKG